MIPGTRSAVAIAGGAAVLALLVGCGNNTDRTEETTIRDTTTTERTTSPTMTMTETSPATPGGAPGDMPPPSPPGDTGMPGPGEPG